MRKKIIKCISLAAATVLTLSVLTGCGGDKAYDYDLSEYVKVGEYKGLTYDKIKVSVSEAEIKSEIKDRCKAAATTEEVKEDTVKDGDTINVSYEGRIDGETFEGGTSESSDITIGTTSMIDGFVEGLIGKEIGKTVTLNLKFPDDYENEDVAGKDVVFDVKINSKKVTVVPEYDLDFVKNNSDCKSLEEYEKSVKADLKAEKEETAKEAVMQALWSELVDKSEVIKYPEEELNAIQAAMKDSLVEQIESTGSTLEDYLESQKTDEKTIDKQIKDYAEGRVFNEMIIYTIARAENLEVTDKEYNDYIDNMLESSGIDEKTFEDTYGVTIDDYCEREGLRPALLYNKVMEKVFEYGKAK